MSAPDPAQQTTETIYDRLGGEPGLRELVGVFYSSIFEDPVLQPVFGSPVATHVDHLTAFLGEVFGGPARYSGELGGFDAIVAVHRGLRITEEQRQRFVAHLRIAHGFAVLSDVEEVRQQVVIVPIRATTLLDHLGDQPIERPNGSIEPPRAGDREPPGDREPG